MRMNTAKTKKSLSKRLKVTKRGKILARQPGQNHFRAKKSSKKKLPLKRKVKFCISKKALGKYLL